MMRVRVQPPEGAAVERDLDGPELVIGRSPEVQLVVPDGRMSRRHARLVRKDDASWWLEDLGARNSTFLNDRQLTGAARLRPGDRIQLGSTVVTFLGPPGAPASEPEPERTMMDLVAYSPAAVVDDDERHAARLRTLNEIHRALAQPISLNALLELILERCFELLRPEEGAVVLRGPDGHFTTPVSRRRGGGVVAVPRRIVDEVAGKGQAVLVVDAALDDRFTGSESVVASGIRSVIAAPLADAEGVLGLLLLTSTAAVRRFVEQDVELLISIASAASLRVRNIALAEEAAARRVLERELALAHEIQMAMLPQRLPERPDVAVAAALTPARSVGGDLYDVILDDRDRLWFVIADVAGKGVSAALYAAVVKTLFRAVAGTGADLLAVVALMNRELARENDRLMFSTAIVGNLDLSSGAVAFVDAGHNPPLVAAGGRVASPVTRKCMAFGVDAEAPYRVSDLVLATNDTLVLYTDGVTDARSVSGELFGAVRFEASVARGSWSDVPAAIVESAMTDIARFSAGAPAEDDITVLAMRYRGR